MSKNSGFLILVNLPKLSVPFSDLGQSARKALFDKDYVPAQPHKRQAWQKATNLGKGGLVVSPPASKKEKIIKKYGVEPRVRLYTEIVCNSYPTEIRHIVRVVTIPTTKSQSGDQRRLANRQLSQKTVAIMSYHCNTNTMISTGTSELSDEDGWVNGDLKKVIDNLHIRVRQQVDEADNNRIWVDIRQWLIDHSAILANKKGAYFIPDSSDVEDELDTLCSYVESLEKFDFSTGEPPSVMVVPVIRNKSGKGFNGRLNRQIAENAISQHKEDLQAIIGKLKPVIGENKISEKSKKVAINIRKTALGEFQRINKAINSYKIALDNDLGALEVYLAAVEKSIKTANRVEHFKPSKAVVKINLE